MFAYLCVWCVTDGLVIVLFFTWVCRSCCHVVGVFFFKQKPAYEIRLNLVGSEMCVRDSATSVASPTHEVESIGGFAWRAWSI